MVVVVGGTRHKGGDRGDSKKFKEMVVGGFKA